MPRPTHQRLPWAQLLRRGAERRPPGPPRFADVARETLEDTRSRRLRAEAGARLRARRARGRAEEPAWEAMRAEAGEARERALADLEHHLLSFEKAAETRGTRVHWARDPAEVRGIVTDLVVGTGARDAVLTSSATLRETGVARALAGAGVRPHESALADLIAALADDPPTAESRASGRHDRARARETLLRHLPGAPSDLPDDPVVLVEAARDHLRDRLLETAVAITGANFLVAETGSVVLMETEGNARMAATSADTLIVVAGIDKIVASRSDLGVLLRTWSRSATGDPLVPVVTEWGGPDRDGDGPRDVHVVLVDAGRSRALAAPAGRDALRCVHCTACLDVCPVFERVGARPYGSVRPGPIGAALTPLLEGTATARTASLPFASTLCGACADVCPVGVDVPEVLLELRARVVDERRANPVPTPESVAMRSAEWVLGDERRYAAAQATAIRWARLLARAGRIRRLPGLLGRWTEARDLPAPPTEPFRAWWRRRRAADGR
ncbi:LUD domain-containing protein [Marinactinospora thermotolerans]|uniref:L-lactate dehydrogenase complex protein LldF n=1 Tax=Marinactinospora thermotolerans DSM 45154 TaxID=1122192 RepID=A0A1T4KAJ3_9ACTN|nr:LUD domain-containing protein [Marinactinospora thermotolerans]SJZ39422.1 L-lactate dehydrogenase complex protein LldF [Marinactinospora thermotolerans DSM 45154]